MSAVGLWDERGGAYVPTADEIDAWRTKRKSHILYAATLRVVAGCDPSEEVLEWAIGAHRGSQRRLSA